MLKHLLVLFAVLVALLPTAALADSPLTCSGVPTPTSAEAAVRLGQEPELYVAASFAGIPALTIAKGKIQYDFCYGQANRFATGSDWSNSYWSRARGYAKLLGVELPFQSDAGPDLSDPYEIRVPVYRHLWEMN